MGQLRLPPSPSVTKSEWALPSLRRPPAARGGGEGAGGVTCRPCSAGLGAAPPATAAAISDTHGAQPARRPGGGPMSGGGGAAGPRLYGYGGALPPAALLRRGLAAAGAVVVVVAAAAERRHRGLKAPRWERPRLERLLLSSPPRWAARWRKSHARLLLPPRRPLRISSGESEGRFDAANPHPGLSFFFFLFLFKLLFFVHFFFSLLLSGVFAGKKDSGAPRGSRSPADAPPRDLGS